MKLLFSSLQLASLCALSSWSVSSQLVVTQSESVTVEEGATVNIFCCWKVEHEKQKSTRVTWTLNTKTVDNERLNINTSCSVLILTNITADHQGTYFCNVNVEIPFLLTGSGNGTVLTVKSDNVTKNNSTDQSDSALKAPVNIIIGLAVAALILLATVIVCCLRRRRVKAARVIYEVPHFDSETPETDKGSMGSRGSSQWCQVPVYESFDYFEHTEAKKNG